MKVIVFLHLLGGSLAILSGYATLFARKGGALHKRSGMIFVWAMLLMGLGAIVIGLVRDKPTWLGGPMVFYFVLTGLTAVRPLRTTNPKLDHALMALGAVVGSLAIGLPVQAIVTYGAAKMPPPVFASMLNGMLCLLGVAGDAKVIRDGPLVGKKRLHRHLWRMCFAMFVATGSFFFGQAKFIPFPLNVSPLPVVLGVMPLAALFYWLWRVRANGRFRFAWPPVVRAAALLLALTLAPMALTAQSVAHGRALFMHGRFAEARAELLQLEKSGGKEAAVASLLGRIALAEGDEEAAIHYLEGAVERDESGAEQHFWLGRALVDAASHASKFKAPFIARRVRKEWERALELDRNNVDARAGLAGFYAMAPGFMGGSITKAREQATEVAKLNPLRGALARADVASSEKNWRMERDSYEQAISIAPDTTAGYVGLADAYARTGRPDSAFATIARYQERRPSDAWGLYYFGRLSGTTGQRLNEGEAAMRHVIASPPQELSAPALARVHYWTGRILEQRGKASPAREQYQLALQANPTNRLAKEALERVK